MWVARKVSFPTGLPVQVRQRYLLHPPKHERLFRRCSRVTVGSGDITFKSNATLSHEVSCLHFFLLWTYDPLDWTQSPWELPNSLLLKSSRKLSMPPIVPCCHRDCSTAPEVTASTDTEGDEVKAEAADDLEPSFHLHLVTKRERRPPALYRL